MIRTTGLVVFVLLALPTNVQAEPYRLMLSDTEASVSIVDGEITDKDVNPDLKATWSVRKKTLRGGRQEGVRLIEIDNGKMTISVVPTRGMSIYKATVGDVTLGWDSPVKELVHPRHINLDRFGGLGWLDGFNEAMVRCGFEWSGHPGEDNGRMLSLHGLAGNIPASKVVLVVDDTPPYRIRLRGRVDEKTFKFSNLEMWTELSTVPGSMSFELTDTLTNLSSYEREFQLIYHGNFGPPLLEKDAEFVGAVKQVTPFDEAAAKDVKTWTTYLGPTKNYGERVYNVHPYADAQGRTKVMLRNAKADRGVAISFNINQLPYLALWKNTDTLSDGYVTGLEPATSFPYNRSVERRHGRVPTLKPGASRTFELEYTVLLNSDQVQAADREIAALQGDKPTRIDDSPEK